jgi:hypothetical protein
MSIYCFLFAHCTVQMNTVSDYYVMPLIIISGEVDGVYILFKTKKGSYSCAAEKSPQPYDRSVTHALRRRDVRSLGSYSFLYMGGSPLAACAC